MTDCTRPHQPRSRARIRHLALSAAAIVAVAFAWLAGTAVADGDPASDVLATQALFLPQDAGAMLREQAQLGAVLSSATRHGFQVRVAVVASAVDLGSVTELWRRPQTYALYLGEELSLVYRGPLLVVMPNGYGLFRATGARAVERSALAGLPPPGTDLARAAVAAVRRLGAADGYRLPLPGASAITSPSSTHAVAWLVFGVGALLVVAAWTFSLRARPLRRRELGRTAR